MVSESQEVEAPQSQRVTIMQEDIRKLAITECCAGRKAVVSEGKIGAHGRHA